MRAPLVSSGLVLAKLSEVLFVETLRRYINALPPDQIGWLAGARDPIIGQALALLHKEPEHPWTVSNLARRVGLSRSRLAERFRHFLGESPMAYLAQWRLKLGAEILQSTEDSVAEVAAAVGYGSQAAFNRAFKREFDCPLRHNFVASVKAPRPCPPGRDAGTVDSVMGIRISKTRFSASADRIEIPVLGLATASVNYAFGPKEPRAGPSFGWN